MFNWKQIYDEIGVGDGNIVVATKQGSVKLEVHQRNGQRSTITLHGCKFIDGLRTNLFSITTALSKGLKLSNKGVHIVLEKDNGKIIFDTLDPTTYGILMTVKMARISTSNTKHQQHHHAYSLRRSSYRRKVISGKLVTCS
jgi:hypothetical protein